MRRLVEAIGSNHPDICCARYDRAQWRVRLAEFDVRDSSQGSYSTLLFPLRPARHTELCQETATCLRRSALVFASTFERFLISGYLDLGVDRLDHAAKSSAVSTAIRPEATARPRHRWQQFGMRVRAHTKLRCIRFAAPEVVGNAPSPAQVSPRDGSIWRRIADARRDCQ